MFVIDECLCLLQAIRVLGLLGALDPYKHKVNIGMIDQSRDASAVSLSESKSSQDSGTFVCVFYSDISPRVWLWIRKKYFMFLILSATAGKSHSEILSTGGPSGRECAFCLSVLVIMDWLVYSRLIVLLCPWDNLDSPQWNFWGLLKQLDFLRGR